MLNGIVKALILNIVTNDDEAKVSELLFDEAEEEEDGALFFFFQVGNHWIPFNKSPAVSYNTKEKMRAAKYIYTNIHTHYKCFFS